MKSLSSSNPIIMHSSQSLEKEEHRHQLHINRLAMRIIRREGGIPHDKYAYIKTHAGLGLHLLPKEG